MGRAGLGRICRSHRTKTALFPTAVPCHISSTPILSPQLRSQLPIRIKSSENMPLVIWRQPFQGQPIQGQRAPRAVGQGIGRARVGGYPRARQRGALHGGIHLLLLPRDAGVARSSRGKDRRRTAPAARRRPRAAPAAARPDHPTPLCFLASPAQSVMRRRGTSSTPANGEGAMSSRRSWRFPRRRARCSSI